MPENAYWFAALSPEKGDFDVKLNKVGQHRSSRATKDLKEWLSRVELPYHSPHKFRHCHAVICMEHAKDIADLKAVSLNLMHSNLSITDGVYGVLSTDNVGKRVSNLGQQLQTNEKSTKDIADILLAISLELRGKS